MGRCHNCMKEYPDSYDMCPYCGYEKGTPPKELYFLTPGTIIQDRYEIGTSAGNGGFGITYRAWDRELQKIVAVKEYYPAGLVNRVPGEKKMIVYSGSRERECMNGKIRFLEEARNMAKFNTHPNIVNVYDFFEENNTAYIIMEYLDGKTFKEYIKECNEKVPATEALEVTEAVLNALQEVHKHNILHRDISPDNIFMCSDGKIKLIDFGAARFSSLDDEKTRSIILKPGFAPPEQYQSKSKQGPWTDIYAMGATLYRAITGKLPEESVNRAEEDLLIDPIKLCPEITMNFNNAILRSMALLPELRFQTIKEFLDALHSESNIRDVRKELALRKRRRLIMMGIVTCMVAVGVGVCLKVLKQKKRSAAILEAAKVTIWICGQDEAELQSKTAMYEDALADFKQDYEQIEIEFAGYIGSQYEEEVEKALRSGRGPTIYETTDLVGNYYQYSSEMTRVFDYLKKSDCYFLDNYDNYFPSKKEIPLTVIVPLYYYNSLVYTQNDGQSTFSNQVARDLLLNNKGKVTKQSYLSYYNMFTGLTMIKSFDRLPSVEDVPNLHLCKDAELSFIGRTDDALVLLGDTTDYNFIEEKAAGCFDVCFVEDAGALGRFDNTFSISNSCSEAEYDAAIQIMVYLLSNSGQDVINIQNFDLTGGLPLHKATCETFESNNPLLEGISKSFEKMNIGGENHAGFIQWVNLIQN